MTNIRADENGIDTRFKPGGRTGRPRGSKNKVTQDLRLAVQQAFQNVGGIAYLERLAVREPKVFAQLVGKCIPKEVHTTLDQRIDLAVLIEDARQRVVEMSHELGATGVLIDGVAERVDDTVHSSSAVPADVADLL